MLHPVGKDKKPLNRSKPNVLIVTQTFPPEPGIGGRRWAKFAKYLHRAGVEPKILTRALKRNQPESLWTSDVAELNPQHINYYKANYPSVLTKAKLGVFDKVNYRVTLAAMNLLSSGNPYDRAALIQKSFSRTLEQTIVANGIRNVIVSGPPFNLLYFAARLKQRVGGFKLLVDFRDGWSWDTRYGMGIIGTKRKALEKSKEDFVIAMADVIMTPSRFHYDNLCRLYPHAKDKMLVTPHAFDSDDLPPEQDFKPKGDYYIYGGALYDRLDRVFIALNRSFRAIDPKAVEIRLHLSNPQKLSEYLEHVDEKYHRYFVNGPQLTPKDFYREVSGARAFLFGSGVPTKITSKVFEILSCKTPILVVGNDGELPHYLRAKDLGTHFEPDEFCFSRAENNLESLTGFSINHKFPDYTALTKELIQHFD